MKPATPLRAENGQKLAVLWEQRCQRFHFVAVIHPPWCHRFQTRQPTGVLWVRMEASRANFVALVGRDGADVKEKPPLREVLWGAVKYSSPRHAEKCSVLPILSEQRRYFFH